MSVNFDLVRDAALLFQDTKKAWTKEGDFEPFKIAKLVLKKETKTLLQEGVNPNKLAEVHRFYGEKVTKKILEWSKKWQFLSDDLIHHIPESFGNAALKFKKAHQEASKNRKYLAYSGARKALKEIVIKDALGNVSKEDLRLNLGSDVEDKTLDKIHSLATKA